MRLECLAVGPLQANCYVVSDENSASCVLMDPGGDSEKLLACCSAKGLTPELVLLTHGHVDHIGAVAAIQRTCHARVLIHEADRGLIEKPHPYWAQMVGGVQVCRADDYLVDGQEVEGGGVRLRVLHTPGHSPGSVCLLAEGVVFTGDTLFAGSVGRTDLPGGSWPVLSESLRRLLRETTLETVVYPGHGPATTMGEELAENPFLVNLE